MAILLSGQSSVFLLIWISIVKFSELFLTAVTYSFLQTLPISLTSYEYWGMVGDKSNTTNLLVFWGIWIYGGKFPVSLSEVLQESRRRFIISHNYPRYL